MPPPQCPRAPIHAPSGPRAFRKAAYSAAAADARWAKLETLLDNCDGEPIRFCDIPWSDTSASLTGIRLGDPATLAKRKLVTALRRWHPDKWRRILDRVPSEERDKVMQRV